MEYSEAAYQNYRDNFPSLEFIQKYFGQDRTYEISLDGRVTFLTLYTEVRRIIGNVLSHSPKLYLDVQNAHDPEFTPVYVFKKGVLESWVDERFEHDGLMIELSTEAFRELGEEFITHFRKGAFSNRDWWHWKCEDNSIWVETIPEAIAAGKHIRRPRTLKDVLS